MSENDEEAGSKYVRTGHGRDAVPSSGDASDRSASGDDPGAAFVLNAVVLHAMVGVGIGLVVVLLVGFGSSRAGPGRQVLFFVADPLLVTTGLSTLLAPVLAGVTGYRSGTVSPGASDAVVYSMVAAVVGSFVLVVIVAYVAAFAEALFLSNRPALDAVAVAINAGLVGLASSVTAAGTAYGSAGIVTDHWAGDSRPGG